MIILLLSFSLLVSQITAIIYISRESGNKNANSNLSISNNAGCEWNITWGGNEQDLAVGIKVDSLDNIYVTGATDFDGSDMSLILLKYNSSGDLQWNRTWAVTGDTLGYKIAFDSLNNIYVTGMSLVTGLAGPSAILLKYNSSGDLDWYKQFVVRNFSICAGIAIGSSDNLYLAGYAMSGLMLDPYPDLLLVKCDSEGNIIWNRTWGGIGQTIGYGIALDSSNNIYITGTTNFMGPNSNICLVKYDNSGNKEWHSIRDVGDTDMAWNLALDSSGNIYVAGSSGNLGSTDACLIKFNSNGQYQWDQTWTGSKDAFAMGIEIDSSDNIYMGGTIDITGFPMYGYLGNTTLVKYDNAGHYQWDYTRSRPNLEGFHSIALDSSEENIYLVGCSDESGNVDILIVKYNLEELSTDGNGAPAIPGFNPVLIIAINCCIIVYFIKKRFKKKE